MGGLAFRLRRLRSTISHEGLRPTWRSPAALTFAVVWVVSATYLAFTGHVGTGLQWLGIGIGLGLFTLLTVGLTADAAERTTDKESTSRSRLLLLQVLLVVALSALTTQRAMVLYDLAPPMLMHIPLWSPFIRFLEEAAIRLVKAEYISNPNYLVNPVTFFLLPLPVVLLLGAGWRTLGFERGHHTWRVVVLWSIPSLSYWVFNLITGHWSIGLLGNKIFSNFMKNGFWEEFLFRGVLQTRLSRLTSSSWAVVLSALLFAIWHIPFNAQPLNGDFLAAAAMSILVQGPLGLALGVIFLRTRNLLACSVIHVVFNTT